MTQDAVLELFNIVPGQVRPLGGVVRETLVVSGVVSWLLFLVPLEFLDIVFELVSIINEFVVLIIISLNN